MLAVKPLQSQLSVKFQTMHILSMLCLAGSYPDEHSDFAILTNQGASVNCVNNNTLNTALDIFHLFRFFMYWNDWTTPSIKTTLTPVYCCLLCITDCVGDWWAQCSSHTDKEYIFLDFSGKGICPCLWWPRGKAKPVKTIGKQLIQPWERFIFFSFVYCFLILCSCFLLPHFFLTHPMRFC